MGSILMRTNRPVYVDANVFLNAILYSPKTNSEAARAIQFLKRVIHNEFDAYTSWLTWDEVIYITRRELGHEISKQKGREFIAYPNLKFENVNSDIISSAQGFLDKYNVRPRDAIHLATAVAKNITEIVTFDQDFKGIEEISYFSP